MHKQIGTFLAVCCAAILADCGKGGDSSSYPSPVYSAFIAKSEPDKEPQCKCAGARGLYVSNPDPDYARWVKVSVANTDTGTGQVTMSEFLKVVDHGEQQFQACSIGPYDVTPACKQQNSLEIVSEGRLITGNAYMTGFGPFFTPTAQACDIACNNKNNPACVNLGAAGKAMIGPMKEMADAAFGSNGVLKITDIQAKYGIDSSQNKCTRGDVNVANGVVENIAKFDEVCDISSSGIAAMVTGIPEAHLILPKVMRLTALAPSAFSSDQDSHVVYSENDATAGQVSFSGTGGDDWNKEFSGNIKAIVSHPEYAVIATSNGCVRADTK
ncbi:hypothetical protein GFL80_08300 [Rhizobium leguminosarum bv. viciae]|uniref:hypothetical protein n=1 Tax=Rhizobium leguminosarum TaxID=384 RepID=UPI00144229BC|nr:hypothetical protein [Rhizobium leguminosarum]NKK84280.1 hypothetical protein [Rhizobium leguminosarum bv. viciae]